jgi:3-oxoacyl-[acyl-carrier protein] reductase
MKNAGHNMEPRFKDKVILITGGCSGIGKATALMAKEESATVAVISNIQKELAAMPEGFILLKADIRKGPQVTAVVEKLLKQTGRIDMLVNSAGVSLWKEFVKMDEPSWDLIFDVNVKGTFLVTQAVARHMIGRKRGFILNISSMSGLKSGMRGASAYTASKWAIVGFSRNLHLELKPHGVNVSCLCPGSTRTPLHEKAKSPDLERMLAPEDVARTVLFMLSAPRKGHVQLLAMPALFEEWR